jgi:hypothetical protein
VKGEDSPAASVRLVAERTGLQAEPLAASVKSTDVAPVLKRI